MINFSRIEPNIFIGSAPQTKMDADRLAQMKITAVISLQSDADLKGHGIDWPKLQNDYEDLGIFAERFPIVDFDEADLGRRLPEPVMTLNQLLSVGHRLYVHCNAGICRAPATVLTYFCHYRGLSIQDGLSMLRKERPQVHPYIGAVELALESLSISR